MDTRASDEGLRTTRTVFSVFRDRDDAEAAIHALHRAGFAERQIGVAMRDRNAQNELIADTGSEVADGAATGAVSGGVIGGLIGLLGSLLVPGLGPIVVGGVLASTLTGAAAGAATGGVIGALIGAGASEDEAHYFHDRLRSGDVLVTVEAGARAEEARRILSSYNADLGPTAVSGATGGMDAIDDADAMDVDDEPIEAIIIEETIVSIPVSSWDGEDRRRWSDPSYSGPERRMAGV